MASSTNYNADEITALIEPVLTEKGYELVEIQFRNEPHGWVLRIIIYKEGGIGVDDCSSVSREVGHILEVEDIIQQKYHLEVSSPGLDRPLTTMRDFLRNKGKKVKVTTVEDDATQTVKGVIIDASDENVHLQTDNGQIAVDLCLVKKAKLIIEF